MFSRERVTLGLLETFEDSSGITVGEHLGDRLSDRGGANRLDAGDEIGLTLFEGGGDGLVVGRVDIGREDRVDDVEASLTVEGSVNGSETTKTVLLRETTTKTPVEVAEVAKEKRQEGSRREKGKL